MNDKYKAEYIKQLEDEGKIDSNCLTCRSMFYPQLESGKKLYEIFAPNHKASSRCESGMHNHCSCDVCF